MLPILTVNGTPVLSIVRNNVRAFKWTGALRVDADGAVHAYRPGGGGLDFLQNALRDVHDNLANPVHGWAGIAVNPKTGKPYVQGEDGVPLGAPDSAGFYVACTALADPDFPSFDTLRYVDSESVPYISVPAQLLSPSFGVMKGDVAMVINERNNGLLCAAIVGDVGPHDAIGEGSICLAKALGLSGNVKKGGGADAGITCIVFPGSSEDVPKRWRRSPADYGKQAQLLYDAWQKAA